MPKETKTTAELAELIKQKLNEADIVVAKDGIFRRSDDRADGGSDRMGG
jgi:hypothetical protein